MDEKYLQLCETIMFHANYFDNFFAKFSFTTINEYVPTSSEEVVQFALPFNFESDTFYIIDVDNCCCYIDSLLNDEVFPIPMLMHTWHQHGVVGNDLVYNTLFSPKRYLKLGLEDHQFKSFAMLFDGQRFEIEVEDLPTNKYDNQWCVYDEQLPIKPFLEEIGYKNITVICDRKRNDLISACSRVYDDEYQLVLL